MIHRMSCRLLALLTIAWALVACSGVGVGDDDDSAPARCDQAWVVPPESGSIVVDETALPGGTGTRSLPFQTIEEGLSLARTRGDRYLLIAPGTYVGTLTLGPGDDDLAVLGCGGDTILDAAGAVGIDVSGASGVLLKDLVIQNANTAVRVGAGAGADDPVQLISLEIEDATRLGVSITGTGTRAVIDDVNVRGVDVDPAGEALGYGLLVWGVAEATVEDLSIRDATRAGVCISDTAQFALRRVTVTDTAPFEQTLGRGIQIQSGAVGELTSVSVSGASDAGIFVLAPAGVVIVDSTVTGTIPADVEGEPDGRSGAGIVATSGVLVEPAPAPMALEVRETDLTNNGRLGVLLEGFGLEATLSGLVFEGNIIPDESTFPLDAPLFQTGADVTVLDGEPAVELLGDDLQPLFRGPLPVN